MSQFQPQFKIEYFKKNKDFIPIILLELNN